MGEWSRSDAKRRGSRVAWTRTKLDAFKREYAEAKPGEVFLFEGHEFLKEYAGYLIEYLEYKFLEHEGRESK